MSWRTFLLASLALHIVRPPLTCHAQQLLGEYPPISSVATYRPVTATSTCGVDGAETYCRFNADSTASLAPNCISDVCNNTCPHSSISPAPIAIATLGSLGSGVAATEGRPGSSTGALEFTDSSITVLAARVPLVGDRGLSFTAWINQDQGNVGTLISKSNSDGTTRNYAITINQTTITLDYLPSTFTSGFRSVSLTGLSLEPGSWHHIVVTAVGTISSFYINGSFIGGQSLVGSIMDNTNRDILLGQLFPSVSSFSGQMQEVYFYNQALTVREITEVYTGFFPFVHLSSACHCPPSHPLIDTNNPATCVQHPPNQGRIDRINTQAHPPSFANDFGTSQGWISAAGERNVNITFQLTNSLYEVIFVNVRYGSPRPKAAVMELSRDGGLTFDPIQYYADDCMFYFGLSNDGQIINADDANCVTSSSVQLPTFSDDVRTRLLDQSQRRFDLNTSPDLRRFILGSHLRLRLVDYFTTSTTLQHQYFSILEVTIAARCACNGHAGRCGNDIDSICDCLHNTEGDNCERCLPFYNDKPWRYGATNNAFPCKPCNCNNHATRCHYNASVDPFPNSYEVGGGGVCDDCQDNTAGPNCEVCRSGFFRPVDRQPTDPSPCVLCNCNSDGITDDGGCTQNEGAGGEIVGQCFCKSNVIGLKCDTCRPSFFGLSADNPDGCSPCSCNTDGTFDGVDTCDIDTGQCLCKANATGIQCDQCKNGTTNLQASNPLGCSGCQCSSIGSISQDCDPITGVCSCKPGIGGPLCNQCLPGFFGFSESGCQPCSCHSIGSLSPICNATTGECDCRTNVEGVNCDRCADGFYDISSGCVACGCNPSGSINASSLCHATSGQCNCKANVEGRTCDTCLSGFTNLLDSNVDGCSACDCFLPSTNTSGSICDPVSSQCQCVPSAMGLRCDACQDGFFLTGSGCMPCDCEPSASSSSVCDSTTGQCPCTSVGVSGSRCNSCFSGFFNFPSCRSCGCDVAGSVEGSVCDINTGICRCKRYVTGTLCDRCAAGFQMLDASNPLGCSAAPDEQAPPNTLPLSATSIQLTWLEPEAPNGIILSYIVYRNSTQIANISTLSYNDTGLTPDTVYSYVIEAFNIIGSIRSQPRLGRTLEGAPTGVQSPTLTALSATSVSASWVEPGTTNGVISRYELVRVTLGSEAVITSEEIVFTGLAMSTTVTGLQSFTDYYFVVRACTSGGCGSSEPLPVRTLEAPPTFQPAPNVTSLSSSSLLITWDIPNEPNGIITRYEVHQRNAPFVGEGFIVGTVLSGVERFTVNDLRPFTVYEFRVVSYSGGGGTPSEWSIGITDEDIPEDVLVPVLSAVSSTEIQIIWSTPQSPNGIIISYRLYRINEGGEMLVASFSEVGSHFVGGLEPFTEYMFLLEACTSVGCNRSEAESVITLESAPVGQPRPAINATTNTSISLEWVEPQDANGIISSYTIHRRSPSLYPSPSLRDIGTSFPGTGFAMFPAGTANLGGLRNEIRMRFRTLSGNGLLLYYINAAGTDLLALELRNGVPWFLFDAGSGPGAIQPQVGAGITFDDGAWHTIVASQDGVSATITVDNVYTGLGQSMGSSQVISSNQVLYIGGLPFDQSAVPRMTVNGLGNPAASVSGRQFAGCLYGVTLNGESLDFTLAQEFSLDLPQGVGFERGCPVGLERGNSYIGGGYVSLPPNTINGSTFTFTFDFRTMHSEGLLLFAYSTTDDETAFAVEIRNSNLHLLLSDVNGTSDLEVSNTIVCDSEWHRLLIDLSRDELYLAVDGDGDSLPIANQDTVFSSSIYIAGIPMATPAYEVARRVGVSVDAHFSGCTFENVVPSLYVDGAPVTPGLGGLSLVRFDGCSLASQLTGQPTCAAPWTSLDVGAVMEYTDDNLTPFSDYLYRVGAVNSAGSAFSGWTAAMTQESAPSQVGQVTLVVASSTTLTVTWDTPSSPNGLITRYDVIATPTSTVGVGSPLGSVTSTTLNVIEPEMVLLSILSGLIPATTYDVVLTAYTSAGGGSGSAVQLQTDESVPVGVQTPVVNRVESRRLEVYWDPPLQPNGIITLYQLFVEDVLRFSGTANSTIIDNLDPFTEYSFFVQACTNIGCSNSTISTGQTLPDSPMGLAAPNLTVLSPSNIQVNWDQPDMPNGVILRFELRRLLDPELAQFEIEFSGLGLETTVTGLEPNTLYTFQLFVFNAGGFASSTVVDVLTLEDIPDGITAPDADPVNATAVLVSWSPPSQPNGDIIQYMLYQNGTLVFSGLQLSYTVTDLQPFTYYSYSISACTVRGCGSSNQSTIQTLEGVPVGYIEPTVVDITPNTIVLQLNEVQRPNGIVEYALYYFESNQFPAESGDLVLAFNGSMARRVEVTGLMPFTNYSFVLEVSNSAGTLRGPFFTVQTDPTAPEGLSAPILSLVNATTVFVEWSPPSQPNGMIQSYQLYLFDGTTTVTLDQGLSTSTLIYNLTPFTVYQVTITVFNTEGSVNSTAANITTGETAPSGFDRIVVLERGSRSITVSWDPPAAPNGILVNYTVLLGGDVITATPPDVLQYRVSPLLPFSMYTFSVMACTSAGCVESQEIQSMTLEDVPEGVPAPFITSTGQRVLITLTPPTAPNGVILEYQVERSLAGEDNFTVIGVLDGANVVLALVDTDTEPFITYDYRAVVVNSAGATRGPAVNFTTPEAAPEGVLPPLLTSLSSRSIEIRFTAPLLPNGIITLYTITRLPPSPNNTITFTANTLPDLESDEYYSYVDQNLNPFTTYNYTLMVCTSGGCTESLVAMVTTQEATPMGVASPTATALSFSEIEVTWLAPQMPNGIIQNYRLLRKFIGFESVEDSLNCCENFLQTAMTSEGSGNYNSSEPTQADVCQLVTMTSAQITAHIDDELRPYTFYQYCVVVTNNANSAFSPQTPPIQTDVAPMPLTGPELNATTLNSTAVELVWGSLEISELFGPLVEYTLYIKVAGDQGLGDILFRGLDQSYTAVNLLASTEYVFVVSVSNGEGVAFGNSTSAVTDEGIPEGLEAPIVDAVSSESISITFSEPLQPNGVIITYTIFLDGVEILNRSAPGIVLVDGLSPYTFYLVQVEACTQFGCTMSPLVAVQTLEAAPMGLASPFVTITGPTSADISWSPPTQPNGNITEYQLLQYDPDDEGVVIFTGIAFSFLVSNLRPFTTYRYQVVAINGAGNKTSVVTMATTQEAPPTSIDPPSVFVLSSNEILVTWSEPDELNGLLQGYVLYRDDSDISSAIFDTIFSDDSLEPFTSYTYIIQVCTNAGCINSSAVSNTTFEALPEGFLDPEITDTQARSISFTWQPPVFPNGIITEYILTLLNSNTVIFRRLALSFVYENVIPYTNYSFVLEVCNSVGCVASNQIDVETLETDPEGLDAPRVRNLTSTSVAIEWRAPLTPNGEIVTYLLRRGNDSFPNDPAVIFEGLGFSYNDRDLIADMSYFYTVEAVNGGGSVVSPLTFFRTVPDLAEGIDPPTLEVRGPTEIHIMWSPPARPNGVISSYILYQNDIAVFTGIGFAHTAINLSPFTSYSFYVEVCNQAGCASSVTVMAVTDQAPPQGVSPPILTVLGSTAIQVSWSAPTQPNGVISRYEIRRRFLNNPITELPQYVGGPSVFTFPNSGLDPFTSYEYRLRVSNAAGDTFSDWVSAMTLEDIPSGIGLPRFADADIFARNVTATWDPPTRPNGLIQLYRLEYRLLFDPATNLPGAPIVAATVPATVTTASVTELTPVTTYEFRVVVVNGAGEGRGEFEAVTTNEDVPEGIQPIIIEQRTGSSLVFRWNPPSSPNGVIREYMLTLDGELVYRNSLTTYTVLRLQPFTSYTLQLAACTSAGCTLGNLQTATTAEVAPAGQATPTLVSLSPRSVEVTWVPPSLPNGIILMYEILRQDDGLPATLTTIYRTNDTLNLNYVDSTVRPAMEYRYLVRAINSAGQTDSALSPIITPEAPPEGLSAPTLTVLSSTSIQVAWEVPLQSNGVITAYRAFRTGGVDNNVTAYSNLNRGFTDTGLTPFTAYSYVIQACTSGGCSLSPSTLARTNEAPPTGLATPTVQALSATSILVSWTPPDTPNGIIQQYNITILPPNIALIVNNNELFRTVSNLQPFTTYTVVLLSCNTAGCAQSIGSTQTLESTPQFIRPPELTAVNATAVFASWSQPSRPNGVIINYQLRRNGSLIFSGPSTTYTDAGLAPNRYYSYTVQAYTSVGGGEESISNVILTLPDTPEDVFPPQLESVSSSSIRVTWREPGSPNGVIQRYVLFQNGALVFNNIAFSYVAQGLDPFTSYSFFLMVCTTTCANSSVVSAQTLEAPPQGQSPPQLAANANITVGVSWTAPSSPNGVITSYEVERRQILDDGSMGSYVSIFNALAMEFLDSDAALQPATSYEYRVSAVNNVGRIASEVSVARLPDAAPENIPPPQVNSVTANSLTVVASPPMTPNGVLTEYRLYQNGTQVNSMPSPNPQTSTVTFQVTGLLPFTVYGFYVEVCTVGGCGQSNVVNQITAEAPPTRIDPPMGMALSSNSINITWRPPQQPNGIILSYTVSYRRACPQPEQPFLSNLPSCTVGDLRQVPEVILPNQLRFVLSGNPANDSDGITPYTAYEFHVLARNGAGDVVSAFSEQSVVTLSAAPEVISNVALIADQANAIVVLDWSNSFRFNGVLRYFIIARNNITLIQSPITRFEFNNEPTGVSLTYVITAVTEVGRASVQAVTQLGTSTPSVTTTTDMAVTVGGTGAPTGPPFYTQAGFIIGMVILGVVILFPLVVLILCLVRPKGSTKFPSGAASISRNASIAKRYSSFSNRSKRYSKMGSPTSPEHGHFTGKWRPGDLHQGKEVPADSYDLHYLTTPSGRSYSPARKMHSLEETLPDTHITSNVGLHQFEEMDDDFGTFKTTFADTKV